MTLNLKIAITLTSITVIFLPILSNADILGDWQDSRAYKPNPVLFVHGFGPGKPSDWDIAKSCLKSYFAKYQSNRIYLETIAFNDPNGSIDTYNNGQSGWSDTLNTKINNLLTVANYGSYTNKVNLVCHSMGGLAGRWYLVNYADNLVDKIILVGTPNNGSLLAVEATNVSKVAKMGWISLLSPTNAIATMAVMDLSTILLFYDINIHGEAIKDMDPTSSGSGFIVKLNSIHQPSNVSYYSIVGIVSSILNWYTSGDYLGGDGIVSKSSQLGTDSVNLEDVKFIKAAHWSESKVAAQTGAILKFLDSTKPEVEVTSPIPSLQTIILPQPIINIKGKVYKEYLPADSKLHIKVTKDALSQPVIDENRSNTIKPSNFWVPKDHNSPVAEFDEDINLPGSGIYSIDVSVVNPAGIESDAKNVMATYLGPATWHVGPLSPTFDAGQAMYLLNKSLSIVFSSSNPLSNPFPGATIQIDSILPTQINTPISASSVIVAISQDVILGNQGAITGMTPCKVTFSQLDLRLNGHVSGVVTGTVKGDINGDGEEEYCQLSGPFNNVLVTLATKTNSPVKTRTDIKAKHAPLRNKSIRF